MAQTYSQKAPFNDWWYWSECLVKRFRTISDLYKENAISPEDRERGTMTDERIVPLSDCVESAGPYFAMVLIPGQGRRL